MYFTPPEGGFSRWLFWLGVVLQAVFWGLPGSRWITGSSAAWWEGCGKGVGYVQVRQ